MEVAQKIWVICQNDEGHFQSCFKEIVKAVWQIVWILGQSRLQKGVQADNYVLEFEVFLIIQIVSILLVLSSKLAEVLLLQKVRHKLLVGDELDPAVSKGRIFVGVQL